MIWSESSKPTVLRDAVAADLSALCAIRDAPTQHEAKLAQAKAGTARFLVALEGDTLVAFATIFLRNPVGAPPKSHLPKLSDCYVSPDFRSRGIGRRLVAERESIARAVGCKQLHVSVHPIDNPRWLAFFLGRGYRTLQPEPYRKHELHHLADGRKQELEVWRQDLVVDLHTGKPSSPTATYSRRGQP